MLTKSQIFIEVKKILIESDLVFIDENQIISPTSNLYKCLNMDLLDIFDFIMAIEKHFGISIPDNNIGSASTLSDFCNCVQKALLKKQETVKKPIFTTKNSLLKRIFTKTK